MLLFNNFTKKAKPFLFRVSSFPREHVLFSPHTCTTTRLATRPLKMRAATAAIVPVMTSCVHACNVCRVGQNHIYTVDMR